MEEAMALRLCGDRAANQPRYSPEVKTALVFKAKDTISSGRLEYDTGHTDIPESLWRPVKPRRPRPLKANRAHRYLASVIRRRFRPPLDSELHRAGMIFLTLRNLAVMTC